MSLRDDVVAAAEACLNTKWRHMGRAPNHGLDCVGLVLHAYRSAGFEPHDPGPYRRVPQGDELLEYVERSAVPDPHPGPGSLVVLWVNAPGKPQHLAVAAHNGTMIHADGPFGPRKVLRVPLDSRLWLPKVIGYYKPEGL